MIVSSALLCLALNIYHESRGESLAGQHAVAQVTMNRANRDPDQVCRVVFAPKQFSWVDKHAKVKGRKVYFKHTAEPKDTKAWALAKQIATLNLRGQVNDLARGATHYHAAYVSPKWSYKLRPVTRIGLHHFYAVA